MDELEIKKDPIAKKLLDELFEDDYAIMREYPGLEVPGCLSERIVLYKTYIQRRCDGLPFVRDLISSRLSGMERIYARESRREANIRQAERSDSWRSCYEGNTIG